MELSLGQRAMRSLILSYAILNLSLCFSIAGQATRAVKKQTNKQKTTTYDPFY